MSADPLSLQRLRERHPIRRRGDPPHPGVPPLHDRWRSRDRRGRGARGAGRAGDLPLVQRIGRATRSGSNRAEAGTTSRRSCRHPGLSHCWLVAMNVRTIDCGDCVMAGTDRLRRLRRELHPPARAGRGAGHRRRRGAGAALRSRAAGSSPSSATTRAGSADRSPSAHPLHRSPGAPGRPPLRNSKTPPRFQLPLRFGHEGVWHFQIALLSLLSVTETGGSPPPGAARPPPGRRGAKGGGTTHRRGETWPPNVPPRAPAGPAARRPSRRRGDTGGGRGRGGVSGGRTESNKPEGRDTRKRCHRP